MDRRTWVAAEKILKEDLANLVIIGTPEDIGEHSSGLDVSGATIINPRTYERPRNISIYRGTEESQRNDRRKGQGNHPE